MKKRLTEQQIRRIRDRHTNLISAAENNEDINGSAADNELGPLKKGILISRFGKTADIEDNETGNIVHCKIRRTIESLTTGDHAVYRLYNKSCENEKEGSLETIEPRTSLLLRPDAYDGARAVAANIDRIIIVCTKEPEFSSNLIDRYIAAAENAKITPVIAVNKYELFTDEEKMETEKILAVYRSIGYSVFTFSALDAQTIQPLKELLSSGSSILAGQSGVGKSTIINALIPGCMAEIGEISTLSKLGQHTTTSSKLYHIGNGLIIDSPGVREFGLWNLTRQELTKSFRDFSPFSGCCRFRDCLHNPNDPGCAVAEAVKDGKIAHFRFDNYHQILQSMQEKMPNLNKAPVRRHGNKYK